MKRLSYWFPNGLASKTFAIAAAASGMVTLSSGHAFAQADPAPGDEINVAEIREELARLKLGEAKKQDDKGFTVVERELDQKNKELHDQEAKLLQQLEAPKGGGFVSTVAPEKPAADATVKASTKPVSSSKTASASKVDAALDMASPPKAAVSKAEAKASIAKTAMNAAPPASEPVNLHLIKDNAAFEEMDDMDAADMGDAEMHAPKGSTKGGDTQEMVSLRKRLAAAEQRNQQLSRELGEARNRLMIAETEVERLSNVVETHTKREMAKLTGVSETRPNIAAQSAPVSRPASYAPPSSSPSQTQDMPIATVMAEKANLRTGPGMENSPLMSVSKGTRLAIEMRKGDWYRVIAPTGARAWVSSDVIAFGRDAMASPTDTFRIKGVN